MREDVFKAVKEYNELRLSEGIILPPEKERFIERLLRDYRRNGLDLPKEDREVLAGKMKELAEVCIKFQKNLNEVVTTAAFELAELDGLPADFIAGLKKTEDGR